MGTPIQGLRRRRGVDVRRRRKRCKGVGIGVYIQEERELVDRVGSSNWPGLIRWRRWRLCRRMRKPESKGSGTSVRSW
jgi:hypothetical protein